VSDLVLLFTARAIRLLAFGFVSVILALYLAAIGLSERQLGVLLTCALVGDAVISLWLTTRADRVGRRRVLAMGAVLMILGGVAFAVSHSFVVLLVAAFFSVLSPNGKEVGPFLATEQAALAQLVSPAGRTTLFARYALVGSIAAAIGALVAGAVAAALESRGLSEVDSYRVLLVLYAVCGALMVILFAKLSRATEVATVSTPVKRTLGLHRSRRAVAKLSGLFAIDSFAGGFVLQSILAYWFHVRFGLDIGALGGIFFATNLVAGLSMLVAARVAARIGLINTMVVTHLPSNVLLCLVPLMPNATLAVAMLVARSAISQMDVPTRQSYTIAVVDPDERAAAAGVTGIARSVGASVSPALCGLMLARPALLSAPFLVAGGLKIVYDLMIYAGFRSVKPPEESD
jgi:MFS family permease